MLGRPAGSGSRLRQAALAALFLPFPLGGGAVPGGLGHVVVNGGEFLGWWWGCLALRGAFLSRQQLSRKPYLSHSQVTWSSTQAHSKAPGETSSYHLLCVSPGGRWEPKSLWTLHCTPYLSLGGNPVIPLGNGLCCCRAAPPHAPLIYSKQTPDPSNKPAPRGGETAPALGEKASF